MIRERLACVLFLFLVLSASIFAQDVNVRSAVDYKANKMKKELNLDENQAVAI